jgi:hypothetical protein
MCFRAGSAPVVMMHKAMKLVNKVKIISLFHGKQMKANNLHMCKKLQPVATNTA